MRCLNCVLCMILCSTDVSETGKSYFLIGAKSSKNLDFGSKFQMSTEIVLVDEFHRNRCQNEALGLNFQEKKFKIQIFIIFTIILGTSKVFHIQNIDFP